MREVLASSTSGIVTDYYQSSTRWYDESAHEKYDRYFVLLSGNELTTVSRSAMWDELISDCLIEELEYDGYYVFLFSPATSTLTPPAFLFNLGWRFCGF